MWKCCESPYKAKQPMVLLTLCAFLCWQLDSADPGAAAWTSVGPGLWLSHEAGPALWQWVKSLWFAQLDSSFLTGISLFGHFAWPLMAAAHEQCEHAHSSVDSLNCHSKRSCRIQLTLWWTELQRSCCGPIWCVLDILRNSETMHNKR